MYYNIIVLSWLLLCDGKGLTGVTGFCVPGCLWPDAFGVPL